MTSNVNNSDNNTNNYISLSYTILFDDNNDYYYDYNQTFFDKIRNKKNRVINKERLDKDIKLANDIIQEYENEFADPVTNNSNQRLTGLITVKEKIENATKLKIDIILRLIDNKKK